MQKVPRDDKAFLRQSKRYVQAPVHRMAAIVPPEFSPLCQQELAGLGIEQSLITEAGVEFSGKLAYCYLSNLWLRTASRILCRVDHFRAGAAEQLFNRVATFRWELWLNPDIPLRIEAHVRDSRIQHPSLVEKTVLDGMQRRFAELHLSLPNDWKMEPADTGRQTAITQMVIVHVTNNYCEISLDTSGAHLHQRGYRLRHTGAPLRETLAAAILMKAGWRGDCPIVDGMCGAGTVPVEAFLQARRLPAGFRRNFLFEKWPAFQEKTWTYLLRKAKQEALMQSPVPIIAVDRDPESIAVARQNAELAGADEDILWQQMDFFCFTPQAMNLSPGVLFLNPPYGKRLAEAENLYERLGAHLHQFFQGWHVAIMAPDRAHAVRLRIKSARYWRIKHGGMPIVVVLAQL